MRIITLFLSTTFIFLTMSNIPNAFDDNKTSFISCIKMQKKAQLLRLNCNSILLTQTTFWRTTLEFPLIPQIEIVTNSKPIDSLEKKLLLNMVNKMRLMN